MNIAHTATMSIAAMCLAVAANGSKPAAEISAKDKPVSATQSAVAESSPDASECQPSSDVEDSPPQDSQPHVDDEAKQEQKGDQQVTTPEPSMPSETRSSNEQHSWLGRLGIKLEAVPPLLAMHLRLKSGRGLLVSDVQEHSEAGRWGVQTGDILIEANQRSVDMGIMHNKTGSLSEGWEELTVIRQGRRRTLWHPSRDWQRHSADHFVHQNPTSTTWTWPETQGARKLGRPVFPHTIAVSIVNGQYQVSLPSFDGNHDSILRGSKQKILSQLKNHPVDLQNAVHRALKRGTSGGFGY